MVRPPGPLVLIAVLTLVLAPSAASAETPRPTEYEVKAAFLYNFAKFVKWPDENAIGSRFVIAVLGEDPFGDVLDRTFAGKTVLDRKVEVRRVSTLSTAGDFQILFVSSAEKTRLSRVLTALEGTSVLTVGEMDEFADRGGMIAFKVKADVVQFDINLDQVNRARLKMSSQLVRLARNVISKDSGS